MEQRQCAAFFCEITRLRLTDQMREQILSKEGAMAGKRDDGWKEERCPERGIMAGDRSDVRKEGQWPERGAMSGKKDKPRKKEQCSVTLVRLETGRSCRKRSQRKDALKTEEGII